MGNQSRLSRSFSDEIVLAANCGRQQRGVLGKNNWSHLVFSFRDLDQNQWGRVDVLGLTHFCQAKFGWDQSRVKQILTPVLDGLEGKAQGRLDAYFFEDGKFAEIASMRIRQAVRGLTLMEPPDAAALGSSQSRKRLRKLEEEEEAEEKEEEEQHPPPN